MDFTEEATSKFVDAGDLRIHYNEAGSGEPLLLIHGGGPGASGWSNYRRNVDALARDFRVLIIDLPGFGKSSRIIPDDNLFTYLSGAVLDFLDALDIAKAHIVGNSLGGGTTLKLALDHPDRVNKFVLMGAGGSIPTFSPMPTEGIMRLLGYYEGDGPSLEKLKAFIDIMVYDKSEMTDELLEERYQASLDPETMKNPPIKWRGKMPLEDLWREGLDELPHEALIIWGREDRVVPMDSAFMLLKQIARARLHVFPQCGHWAQWEKADEFNQLVADFLKP